MFGFRKKTKFPTSLEDRLEALSQFGIKLNKDASIEDLLVSGDRSEYESDSLALLLMMLGSEVETGINSGAYFTNQLWNLDTERIEDSGDYWRIILRFDEMFENQLTLTKIQDKVDYDEQEAWVSFESNGKVYQADLEFDDDWMDPNVLKLIIAAATDAGTERILGIGEPDGQSMNLCVMTPQQMKQLNMLTGTNYQPLKLADF